MDVVDLSLRKEIQTELQELAKHIIDVIVFENWNTLHDVDHYIDNIISMFEKRIDARISYYESDGSIVGLSDNLEIIKELQNIKEMLK